VPQADSGGNPEGLSPLTKAERDADAKFGNDAAGSVSQPCSANSPPMVLSKKEHWIEILLVDDEGFPVPNEKFIITVPGGAVVPGTLDSKGRARIEGIDPGNCVVTFPQIDKSRWKQS